MRTRYNDMHHLKQDMMSVSNSGQQYQTSSKFGQPFQSYSKTGSLTSGGKSGSIEIGVQNGRDKLSITIQNHPHFNALEARNSSQNRGFKEL